MIELVERFTTSVISQFNSIIPLWNYSFLQSETEISFKIDRVSLSFARNSLADTRSKWFSESIDDLKAKSINGYDDVLGNRLGEAQSQIGTNQIKANMALSRTSVRKN